MIRAYLAALWYRIIRDPDPYPPAAAEAPDPVDQPMVVAGSDLDASFFMRELYDAIDRYRRGEAIESGAPKEMAP
jgi:hypothetical protein